MRNIENFILKKVEKQPFLGTLTLCMNLTLILLISVFLVKILCTFFPIFFFLFAFVLQLYSIWFWIPEDTKEALKEAFDESDW